MAVASASARPSSSRRLAALAAAAVLAISVIACNDPGATAPSGSPPGGASASGSSGAGDPSTASGLDPAGGVPPEAVAGPDLGDDAYEPIDAESVVPSPWGLVPNDRLWLILAPGSTRADAARIANRMGGSVGGRIEVADLWQVLIPPQSPDGLLAAYELAGTLAGVDVVIPDVPVVALGDCATELGDPVYAGTNADPYDMVGVSDAWQTWFASGVQKHPVHVGIVDSALTADPAKQIEWEFDNVTWVGEPATTPNYAVHKDTGKVTDDGFNHADGVLGIIAGDRTDGGIAGIASPLGGNLMVSHADFQHPPTVTAYDPDAIELQGGQAYTSTLVLDVKRQIESGATIINLSVGTATNGPEHAGTAEMWRRFYAKMATEHPEVLFVAAAGNNTALVDGHNSGPGGIAAPNVITVGSVQTSESITSYSNEQDPSSPDGEVTLFAPGDEAVWGLGIDGQVQHSGGGTSSAAPMVTATAALIRSVNPKLTAAEIKQLILDTTRASFDPAADAQVLQVDAALREAIDDVRLAAGGDPLTDEEIADAGCQLDVTGRIEAMLADPAAAKWRIEAVVPGAEDPTVVTLTAAGGRPADWRQTVDDELDEAAWTVLVPKGGLTITVTRLDSGFWVKYRLGDGLDASPTPAPTAAPTPKPRPTPKPTPKPTRKPSNPGYDCSNPPTPGTIAYMNWSLHCKSISP
jgi:hypothetical protein